MKTTSANCVEWIIQKYAPNTSPSEWKRRSKTKRGNAIVRLFENTRTGVTYQVYEQNGIIIDQPSLNPQSTPLLKKQTNQKKIYYAIARTKTNIFGGKREEPAILLYVADSDVFDEEGYQDDRTPDGTFEELENMGYDGSEWMEAVIELGPIDVEELKRKLASSPIFRFKPAFQKFLQSTSEERDDEIISI